VSRAVRLLTSEAEAAIGGQAEVWLRVLRFVASGVLNTAFGYLVFLLVLRLVGSATAALVASTTAGILFNYQTSRRIVFRSGCKGGLPAFAALYGGLFAVNETAILALQASGVPAWASQALLLLPMAAASFMLQQRLVFAQRRLAA
jgi:putative flippase GtrA